MRDTWEALRAHMSPGRDAERGAELLLSLLSRVWYAPGAAAAAAAAGFGQGGDAAAPAQAGAGGGQGPLFVPELE